MECWLTADSSLVGSSRVLDLGPYTSEFGMLVSAPEQRGTGIGRELVAYAEWHARDRGRRAMQLELLVTRHGRHPSKAFLASWYARIGNHSPGRRRVPAAGTLAVPCELLVCEKPLSPAPTAGTTGGASQSVSRICSGRC
jgi:GNAT superfamily N-acetyltransferase